MEIIEILKKSESKTVEFKQDLSSPLGILRTIVAFANTAGGIIVLGIEDKTKHVCGIKDPLEMEEKLANLINDGIEPQLLPEIEVKPWRDTYLLTVQIFPSPVKPHYLKKQSLEKGTYIRVGSTNRLADQIMLTELRRVRINDSFDKQPIPTCRSEDLEFSVIADLFSPHRNLTAKDLETLDLITTYHGRKVPTAGGIILFGKDRFKYFPDTWIQAGRFEGDNKTSILDTQEITSHPILAIDEAINFIMKHSMRTIEIPGMSLSKSGSRSGAKTFSLSQHRETWNIPLTSIREAIINAFVHTDYAQQGSPIRISIFDNRIEIENPGLLLFGITIEDIKHGISKLRNRVIGQIFYRLNLIERWGSGIKRIIDLCTEAGLPEPVFEEIGTHFRVTIFTQQTKALHVNITEQEIIEVLQKTNGLSTKEIANYVKKSERTVRNRLIALIDKGLVMEASRGINDPKRKYYYKDKF